MLGNVINYLDIIMYILLAIMVMGTIVFFVIKKKKIKFGNKSEDKTATSSNAKYLDVLSFLDKEDILETNEGAVIVMKKNKRYIAMLGTTGNDYFNESHDDKAYIIGSEIARANIIDKPMMTWQYSRPLSVSSIIDKYQKKIEELENIILEKQADFEEMKGMSSFVPDSSFEEYYRELENKRKELYAYDFRRKIIEEQINFIKRRQKNKKTAEQCICYVIEWDYDPNEYTEELDEKEVWIQAQRELGQMANEHIKALRESSVYVWRMTKNEIIEAVRQHTHPAYANVYDIDKIFNSNRFEFVTDSESYDDEMDLAAEEKKENEEIKRANNSYVLNTNKRKKQLLNNNVIISLHCENCKRKIRISMTNNQYGRYIKYLNGEGTIQDMLFDLSEDYREFIITGLCSKCSEEME